MAHSPNLSAGLKANISHCNPALRENNPASLFLAVFIYACVYFVVLTMEHGALCTLNERVKTECESKCNDSEGLVF